jgi:hypothetical protein
MIDKWRLEGQSNECVKVSYFSDALCIWAYVAQARIDAVAEKFGDTVRFEHRFCSVFGDTAGKIASTWQTRVSMPGSIHTCRRWRCSSRISKFIRKFG